MAKSKTRKKRVMYSAAKRTAILTAAQEKNLTAKQVQKRFGVTPVTYYSWRKKAKLPTAPRGRRPGSGGGKAGRAAATPAPNGAAEKQLLGVVRRRVQAIIQEEIRRVLEEIR